MDIRKKIKLILIREVERLKHVASRIRAYKNYPTLIWPLTRILKEDRVMCARSGSKMYVRSIFGPHFVVVHEMFARDDYQISSVKLKSNPTVLDIGANIGAFSILVANRHKDAKIFSYEPEKNNMGMLLKNIKLGLFGDRIFPKPLAVSDVSGTKNFFLSSAEDSHSLLQEFTGGSDTVEVKCTTIKDILNDNKIDFVDLLKLDIEGIEYDILYNLPEEIFSKIGYLVLEIHDRRGYQRADLIQFIKDKNFTIVPSLKNRRVFVAKNSLYV